MRLIKETSQSEGQLAQKMAELVVYMAWRSEEEILNVYEHFLLWKRLLSQSIYLRKI